MLTVCNYHYIRENFEAKYPSIFGVTPKQFKGQLLKLKNEGEFISLTQLGGNIDLILNSKDNFCLITFDDGLKEQFKLGLSILEDLSIPALFFANSINHSESKVSTVHKIHLLRSILDSDIILKSIEKTHSDKLQNLNVSKIKNVYIYDKEKSAILKYVLNFVLNYKEQELMINNLFSKYFNDTEVLNNLYMTLENLKALASLGYLGSHTHSHYPLGLLKEKSILKELSVSKKYLERHTKSKIEAIAYPYGSNEACTIEVADLAKKTGYKFGFTTKRGLNLNNQNRLLLNRFDCNDLIGGKNYKL